MSPKHHLIDLLQGYHHGMECRRRYNQIVYPLVHHIYGMGKDTRLFPCIQIRDYYPHYQLYSINYHYAEVQLIHYVLTNKKSNIYHCFHYNFFSIICHRRTNSHCNWPCCLNSLYWFENCRHIILVKILANHFGGCVLISFSSHIGLPQITK